MSNNPTLSLNRFVINLVNPYKGLLSVIAVLGVFWACINTLSPYVLKLIIDHVVDFKGDKSGLFTAIQPYVFGYIALWVGLCIDARLLDWMKLRLLPKLREDIISKMFNYLNQHSHRYFQNNFSGSLVNKISDMQNSVIDIFTLLEEFYSQILGISVAVITLLFIHPIFSVILMGWALAFFLFTVIFLRRIQNLARIFSESKTSVIGKMVDSIGNIVNVRLFARHVAENQYIHHCLQDMVKKDGAMQMKIIQMQLFWSVSIIALMSLNLYFLLHMYAKNIVSIGDFTFIITLAINILWNLWFLMSQFVSFAEQVGKCKQALSIIALPHEIVDAADAKPLLVSKGSIQFHNVTFHHEEGKHLFKNKNVVIAGGQKIGLVGFTGSGKSTFVNLILRLFEVESGKITIDDQNIKQVTQKSLREQIALIQQDIGLFHRTLMENIRFGNMNATDEAVIESAKKAHCHEFISQLAGGYQSMVGERGIKLSGGQRQCIAIARAMLKNVPILILDEATSSLDSITEKYIQDALNLIMQNKTTIVIAHRLSTLSKMDRILVFDNGKIIEDGTHEELVAKDGHYAKMWKMQAGGFLPNAEDRRENT